MAQIQAVVFDYGLVLSGPPDPVAWLRMQTAVRANDPEFRDSYWRYRHDYDLGAIDGVTYWQTIASDLRQSLTRVDVDALLDADIDLWTQPNQPMIDWAQSLQKSGTCTAILSNMPGPMEAGILKRFPWMAGFTHHTFSHCLHLAKPDERIYRHAIAELALSPESILFIDDRAENIEAARALGIHAIQYLSHKAFLCDLESCGFSGFPLPHRACS